MIWFNEIKANVHRLMCIMAKSEYAEWRQKPNQTHKWVGLFASLVNNTRKRTNCDIFIWNVWDPHRQLIVFFVVVAEDDVNIDWRAFFWLPNPQSSSSSGHQYKSTSEMSSLTWTPARKHETKSSHWVQIELQSEWRTHLMDSDIQVSSEDAVHIKPKMEMRVNASIDSSFFPLSLGISCRWKVPRAYSIIMEPLSTLGMWPCKAKDP